jgi:hypothetical protein
MAKPLNDQVVLDTIRGVLEKMAGKPKAAPGAYFEV